MCPFRLSCGALLTLAFAASCGGSSAPTLPTNRSTQTAPPAVDVVGLDEREHLVFFHVSSDGAVRKTGDVAVAGREKTLRALPGGKVAVLSCEVPEGPCEVGIASPSGYTKLAQPDPWPAEHAGVTEFLWPYLELYPTATGELWLARCRKGYEHLPGVRKCVTWAYARISPGPFAYATTPPTNTLAYQLEHVPPPDGVRVELVGKPARLRCTMGGRTHELGRDDGAGYTDVRWLSADPPLFRVTHAAPCAGDGDEAVECRGELTFAGCGRSLRFYQTDLEPGPPGVVAMSGQSAARLLWHAQPYANVPARIRAFLR